MHRCPLVRTRLESSSLRKPPGLLETLRLHEKNTQDRDHEEIVLMRPWLTGRFTSSGVTVAAYKCQNSGIATAPGVLRVAFASAALPL